MLSDKILIVDDDPKMIASLKRALSEFEIIAMQEGSAAFRYLSKPHNISLVLLDIFLRDENGLEILSEIRKRDESIPVIVMTGYGSMDIAIQALRYRADDLIEKPFDIRELNEKIHFLLKRRSYTDKEIPDNKDKVARMKRYIQRNPFQVSLDHIAQELQMSKKYAGRLFKQKTKNSYRKYKLLIKLNKAKELLESTSYNVNEIADKLGYQNPESFMRIFKKVTKLTPTQYRRHSNRKRNQKKTPDKRKV